MVFVFILEHQYWGEMRTQTLYIFLCSLLLAPLVLLPDLLLLGGREVVLDVEGLPDLIGRLALDHVGHRLARHVEQALDVQVVGGKDQLEQGALRNGNVNVFVRMSVTKDGAVNARRLLLPV